MSILQVKRNGGYAALLRSGSFCLFLLGGHDPPRPPPPIYATAALFAETIDQPVNMSAKEKILPCSINPIRDSHTPAMRQEALETKFEITSIESFDFHQINNYVKNLITRTQKNPKITLNDTKIDI